MTIYWSSTKAPVHLFPREYESKEVAQHVKENSFVDPAILATELHISAPCITAYQRRLGIRKLADNNPKSRRRGTSSALIAT